MATPTLTQLQNAERDLQTIEAVSNDLGTTTTREGTTVKTVRQVVIDAENELNGAISQAEAWASNPEDVPVVSSPTELFSSFHYSQKAAASLSAFREVSLGNFADNAAAEAYAAANGTLAAGDEYFNTTVNRKRVYDGTVWYEPGAPDVTVSIANGGTGATTAAAARASLDVAGKSATETITGAHSFTNAGSSFTGDGSGLINLSYESLSDASPTVGNILGSLGRDEFQSNAGIGRRVVSISGTDPSYVVNQDDFLPAIHSIVPDGTSTKNLDVSGLAVTRSYRFVNTGAFGSVVTLNVDENKYFKSNWISPSVTNIRSFDLKAGEAVTIFRLSTSAFVADRSESGLRITNGPSEYVREKDGTYRLIYTRTDSISGSAESTANTVPAAFSLDNAHLESVCYLPDASGTAQLDLLPQVTKIGTTHSLSANQFAIRNPNAGATAHPIRVIFSNVTEV